MSNHRYSKFWWPDWLGDKPLQRCSPAARALWIDLLCLMHEAKPYGHLMSGEGSSSHKTTLTELQKDLRGFTVRQLTKLLDELESHSVFSRKEDGTIYSRRMVRDWDKAEKGSKAAEKRWNKPTDPPNGSGGGSPKGKVIGSRYGIPCSPITHRSYSESEAARDAARPIEGQASRSEAEEERNSRGNPETNAIIVQLEATKRPGAPALKPAYLTPEQLAIARKKHA